MTTDPNDDFESLPPFDPAKKRPVPPDQPEDDDGVIDLASESDLSGQVPYGEMPADAPSGSSRVSWSDFLAPQANADEADLGANPVQFDSVSDKDLLRHLQQQDQADQHPLLHGQPSGLNPEDAMPLDVDSFQTEGLGFDDLPEEPAPLPPPPPIQSRPAPRYKPLQDIPLGPLEPDGPDDYIVSGNAFSGESDPMEAPPAQLSSIFGADGGFPYDDEPTATPAADDLLMAHLNAGGMDYPEDAQPLEPTDDDGYSNPHASVGEFMLEPEDGQPMDLSDMLGSVDPLEGAEQPPEEENSSVLPMGNYLPGVTPPGSKPLMNLDAPEEPNVGDQVDDDMAFLAGEEAEALLRDMEQDDGSDFPATPRQPRTVDESNVFDVLGAAPQNTTGTDVSGVINFEEMSAELGGSFVGGPNSTINLDDLGAPADRDVGVRRPDAYLGADQPSGSIPFPDAYLDLSQDASSIDLGSDPSTMLGDVSNVGKRAPQSSLPGGMPMGFDEELIPDDPESAAMAPGFTTQKRPSNADFNQEMPQETFRGRPVNAAPSSPGFKPAAAPVPEPVYDPIPEPSEIVDESPESFDEDARTVSPADSGVSNKALASWVAGLVVGTVGLGGAWLAGFLPQSPNLLTKKPVASIEQPQTKAEVTPTITKPAPMTLADAGKAVDAGDLAGAVAVIEKLDSTGANAPAIVLLRTKTQLLQALQAATAAEAQLRAEDPAFEKMRSDLQAIVKATADTPEASTDANAAQAMLWMGLVEEALGRYEAARSIYTEGEKRFAAEQQRLFQIGLTRLDAIAPAAAPAPDAGAGDAQPMGRRMNGAEVLLAFTMLGLQSPEAEAPKADAPKVDAPKADSPAIPDEAGFKFWEALQLAKQNRYAEARKAIEAAKDAHRKRSLLLPGKRLNPVSDPFEAIFSKTCDEMSAYWALREQLYGAPGVKSVADKSGLPTAIKEMVANAASSASQLQAAQAALKELKLDTKPLPEAIATLALATSTLEKEKKTIEEQLASLSAQLKDGGIDEPKLEKAIVQLLVSRKEADDKLQALAKAYAAAGLKGDDLLASTKAVTDRLKSLDEIVGQAAKMLAQSKLIEGEATPAKVLAGINEAIVKAKMTPSGTSNGQGVGIVSGASLTSSLSFQVAMEMLKGQIAEAKTVSAAEIAKLKTTLTESVAKLEKQLADDRVSYQKKLDADKDKFTKELADAQASYNKQLADAEKKLTDAQSTYAKQLADAEKKAAADLKAATETAAKQLLTAKMDAEKAILAEKEEAKKVITAEKTAAAKAIADQKAAFEKAIATARKPVDLLDTWMAALDDPSQGTLAPSALVDAKAVLDDESATPENQAKASAVKALALRNQGDLTAATAAIAETKKLPGWKADAAWAKQLLAAEDAIANPAKALVRTSSGSADPKQMLAQIESLLKNLPAEQKSTTGLPLVAQRARLNLTTGQLDEALTDVATLRELGAMAEATLLAGQIADKKGQLVIAEEYYRQVLAMPKISPAMKRDAQLSLARLLLRQPASVTPKPVTPPEKATQRTPSIDSGLVTLTVLGLVMLEPIAVPADSDRLTKALELADQLIQSGDATGHFVKAKALLLQGQYNAALTEYTKGFQKVPNPTDEDRALLEQILKVHPAFQRPDVPLKPNPLEAARFFGLGTDAYYNGQFADAEKYLSKAIQNEPRDARLFYFLALSRLAQQKDDLAKSDFDAAAKLEAVGKPTSRMVDESLVRIQGQLRDTVNRYRP